MLKLKAEKIGLTFNLHVKISISTLCTIKNHRRVRLTRFKHGWDANTYLCHFTDTEMPIRIDPLTC